MIGNLNLRDYMQLMRKIFFKLDGKAMLKYLKYQKALGNLEHYSFVGYQSEKRIENFFDSPNKRMLEEKIEKGIIMDDASTDASHTIALELEKQYIVFFV